jgi:thymidylate synthase
MTSIITADKSWLDTIAEVRKLGQAVEPQKSTGAKDRVSFEIINHSMVFDMRWPVVTVKPNTSWLYMAAEPMWVIEGSGNLNYFPEIYRIQLPYSDNGVSVYGAYGPRYKLQKQNVIDKLNYDRNTRQAVMMIWRRNPPLMKDIPCVTSIQWLIRDDKIYTIVNMRSSDVGMGLPYDMLTFTCMTMDIASYLNEPVELGKCYINAGSRHIYEDQWDKLNIKEMVLHEYRYPAWNMWKWTAIKQTLKKIAQINTFDLNRRDVQAECFKAIMEISGGKTNAGSDNDENSTTPSSEGDV